MITTVTCWAARWSRNARIWLVIDPHVVTVDEVFRPLPPWMRMQTFASRLETSMPAHRGCTTSMTRTSLSPADRGLPARTGWQGVCSGEGGSKQDSDVRAHRQQSTVPADKLLCPPPPN